MKLQIHMGDLPQEDETLYVVKLFDKFGPYDEYFYEQSEALKAAKSQTPQPPIYTYNGGLVEIEVEECTT